MLKKTQGKSSSIVRAHERSSEEAVFSWAKDTLASLMQTMNSKQENRSWCVAMLYVLALTLGFTLGTGSAHFSPEIGAAIIQIFAGAIAGGIALWQFTKNFQQREDHQEEVRLQVRRKELQDQFVDIQNRLASTESIIRTNAALRLGQFGKFLKLGETEGAPLNEENYPYFVPAVSQLATVLYTEWSTEIRRAVTEAIEDLANFSSKRVDEGSQQLLHALIERLAVSNRIAKEQFIRAFAEYWAIQAPLSNPEREDYAFNFIAPVLRFCNNQEAKEACLVRLFQDGNDLERIFGPGITNHASFGSLEAFYNRLHEVQENWDEKKALANSLSALRTAEGQLMDSRDALAFAVRRLPHPATSFEEDTDTGSFHGINLARLCLRPTRCN